MKLLALSVGLPREVTWHNRLVTTGIFKQPVVGRVALRKLNLDGDRQADLTVHGGEFKAVYCSPSPTTGNPISPRESRRLSPNRTGVQSISAWAPNNVPSSRHTDDRSCPP